MAVIDGDEAVLGRRGVGLIRFRDTNVVTVDTAGRCESCPLDVDPIVERRVPRVGGVAQVPPDAALAVHIGGFSGNEQRRDLGGQCKRRIARIFLPSVLDSPVRSGR
jgi:hypothetical protein